MICGVLFFLDEPVIRIFNRDAAFVSTAAANAIAISRGILVKSPAIFCLPVCLSGDMIWAASLTAEIVTLLFTVGFTRPRSCQIAKRL